VTTRTHRATIVARAPAIDVRIGSREYETKFAPQD
jgi:hypothetical protein